MIATTRAPAHLGGPAGHGRHILTEGLRVHRSTLIRAAALLSVHQVCEVAVPILVGVIVDRALADADVTALIRGIAVLAAVFVALTVSYRYGARAAMRAAQDESHRLRLRCATQSLDPAEAGEPQRTGDLLSIANSDADETGGLLRFVPQTVAAVTALTACAVALLSVDVTLGVIVLIGVPVILSLVQVVAPLVTRRVGAQQHHIGRATAVATDLLTGLRALRGMGAQTVAAQRYRTVNEQARAAGRRAAVGHGMFFGTATGVTGVLAVGVATLTGWFALTDRITVGALIAVLGVAQFLTEPLAVLAMMPGRVATARASADRIATVAPAGRDRVRRASTVTGVDAPGASVDATVDIVANTTEPEAVVALCTTAASPVGALRCGVRPGELAVFVAPSPVLAQRLVDLLDGQDGSPDAEVRVLGHDSATLPASLRPRGLLVEPHGVDLFTGTVGSNLAIGGAAGAQTTGAESVLAVLTAMGSRDLVDEGPADSPTDAASALRRPVSDRGQSLSGGQRQRLALARAILTDPSVLVLHEPTTAVDSVTEHRIVRAVRDLRHHDGSDRVTVVVTAGRAWRSVADQVIELVDQHAPDEAPAGAATSPRADAAVMAR